MQDCLAEQAPSKGGEEQENEDEQEGEWVHPDVRLGITAFNDTRGPVTMKMYSQNRRGKEWGPYELTPVGKPWPPSNLVIECKMDEYICMGAWDSSGETWGVGQGHQRCEDCCIRCNGRGYSWQMQDAIIAPGRRWSGFLR
jgi:hypothetical protein